jgi:hypothetical protein
LLGGACALPRGEVVAAMPRAAMSAEGAALPAARVAAVPVPPRQVVDLPLPAPPILTFPLLSMRSQQPAVQERGWWGRTFDKVAGDYTEFYDTGTLLALGTGVGLGALAANTSFDRDVRDGVQNHWVSKSADDVRKVATHFGDGEVLLPVYALSAFVGPLLGSEVVGEWGERSLRAMAVATPMLLALQRVTGGSRPDDPLNKHDSKWVFLDASYGVSGHATIGSITFLSMAKQTDSPVLDALFYAASVVPALARVQDDRHYFSQAAMGWLLGYLATEAVDDNEQQMRQRRSTTWMPVIDGTTVGFAVVHRF